DVDHPLFHRRRRRPSCRGLLHQRRGRRHRVLLDRRGLVPDRVIAFRIDFRGGHVRTLLSQGLMSVLVVGRSKSSAVPRHVLDPNNLLSITTPPTGASYPGGRREENNYRIRGTGGSRIVTP